MQEQPTIAPELAAVEPTLAAAIREGVYADRALWAQVPWAVMLITCRRQYAHERTVTFETLDPSSPIRLAIGPANMPLTAAGYWDVSLTAFRNEPPVTVVNCATGLVEVVTDRHFVEPARPATDAEVLATFSRRNLLDPSLLVELIPTLLAEAELDQFLRVFAEYRITPHGTCWSDSRPDLDAALLALAPDWTASVAALVNAAGLLVRESPATDLASLVP